MKTRPAVALALAAAVTSAALLPSGPAVASDVADPQVTRMNHVQVVGSHNSYHQELSPTEQRTQAGLFPAYPSLYYTHAPLTRQLDEQRVRSIELDVNPDPQGGLYRYPLVRKKAGLGPLTDPAWSEPGTKVLHIVDIDYGTSCVQFTSCLREVKTWSDAHRGHTPIMILLEFKGSVPFYDAIGGVTSPKWTEARFADLEAEILSVFDRNDLVTPDDIRRPGMTLEQSVLQHGWPTQRQATGKVMFAMDNTDKVRSDYLAGHPNLEGRLLFTDSAPGQPEAAFMKRNDPRGTKRTQIQDLVRSGYYVRTRADEPMATVLFNNTRRRANALGSGAQVVSTDFPAVGMAARWGSDYHVALPGAVPVRCNPVKAPSSCQDADLER